MRIEESMLVSSTINLDNLAKEIEASYYMGFYTRDGHRVVAFSHLFLGLMNEIKFQMLFDMPLDLGWGYSAGIYGSEEHPVAVAGENWRFVVGETYDEEDADTIRNLLKLIYSFHTDVEYI